MSRLPGLRRGKGPELQKHGPVSGEREAASGERREKNQDGGGVKQVCGAMRFIVFSCFQV